MRGLEVQLNGENLCTAGIDQAGVLNAMVDIVWRVPKTGYAMRLLVGGLQGDDHLMWAAAELAIGDKIAIRVVETPSIDLPTQREANIEHPSEGQAVR